MDHAKYGHKGLEVEELISKAAGNTRIQRINAVIWSLNVRSPSVGSGPRKDELLVKLEILDDLWQAANNPAGQGR